MKLLRIATAFLLTAAFAVTGFAQCPPVPDGLDQAGLSCSGANTNVPQRGFQQSALGICWLDCAVDTTSGYTAQWGALNPVNVVNVVPPIQSCAWYRARLKLYNGSGLQWDGQMHFSYSRTWIETPIPGQFIQVWRYLVNGDLKALTPAAMPCGTPACAGSSNNLVRFTGYVDYAYDCASQLTRRAWMITHACDAIDHASGFPRAGSFHPNRHYTFVGPAAGFIPGVNGTLESGSAGSECVRKWDALALPARCALEEPILAANFNPLTPVCMCGTGAPNWHEAQLFIAGGAGTVVTNFVGGDPYRSFPIGVWTNANVFPGVEELRWNCNEANWQECTGFSRNEYYFGVTTSGGWPAMSFPTSTPPMSLPPTFIDQANSVLLPANVSTRNRTYKSDHIINLNL